MKGRHHAKSVILCIFVIPWVLLTSSCSLISAYYSLREERYYSDRDNYLTSDAQVVNIITDHAPDRIVFWLDVQNEEFKGEDTFELCGENAERAVESGALEQIRAGDTVTVVCAPAMFGDGYIPPLVGLIKGDTVFLDAEEGIRNLLDTY